MKQPDISIVIAAYNEEKYLPRLFASIKKQDFKGNYEVIVVDNNSTDKTAQVAKEFGARVVKERIQGIGPAKNRGCLAARGKILAICDADNILPSHWLSAIWRKFSSSSQIVAVSGSVFISDIPRPLSWLLWAFYLLYLILLKRLEGANMAFRKNTFLEVGGFTPDIKFGEHIDISEKMKKRGRIVIDPRVYVYYSPRRFKKLGWIRGFFPYLKYELKFLITKNINILKEFKLPLIND